MPSSSGASGRELAQEAAAPPAPARAASRSGRRARSARPGAGRTRRRWRCRSCRRRRAGPRTARARCSASTRSRSPSAVTRSTARRLSTVSPCRRIRCPKPPPSVSPPMPTWLTGPAGGGQPVPLGGEVELRPQQAAGGARDARGRVDRHRLHQRQVDHHRRRRATAYPSDRVAAAAHRRPAGRARARTAARAATSSAPAQRAISAGRRSIAPFQTGGPRRSPPRRAAAARRGSARAAADEFGWMRRSAERPSPASARRSSVERAERQPFPKRSRSVPRNGELSRCSAAPAHPAAVRRLRRSSASTRRQAPARQEPPRSRRTSALHGCAPCSTAALRSAAGRRASPATRTLEQYAVRQPRLAGAPARRVRATRRAATLAAVEHVDEAGRAPRRARPAGPPAARGQRRATCARSRSSSRCVERDQRGEQRATIARRVLVLAGVGDRGVARARRLGVVAQQPQRVRQPDAARRARVLAVAEQVLGAVLGAASARAPPRDARAPASSWPCQYAATPSTQSLSTDQHVVGVRSRARSCSPTARAASKSPR